MKELYISIIRSLTSDDARAGYIAAELAPCGYVDLYRGQYIDWEGHEVFPMPAVFFEWQASHDFQNGAATITLHLCYEQIRDTSSRSRSGDKAIKFFDFIQHTHSLIADLESARTGKMRLVSEENVKHGTVADVHLLTYECSFRRTADDVNGEEQEVEMETLEVNGVIKYDFQ